jgi:hypothetical protein
MIDKSQTPSHLEYNIALSKPVRNDCLDLVKGGEFFFIAEYLSACCEFDRALSLIRGN